MDDKPTPPKVYRAQLLGPKGETQEWRIETVQEVGHWYATPRDAEGVGFSVGRDRSRWHEFRAVKDVTKGGTERDAIEAALEETNNYAIQKRGPGWRLELIDRLPD